MKRPLEWVLASHNPGKIKELTALLSPRGIGLRSAADFSLSEPDETETTFAGNAALKARAVMEATGLASLADDSGLAVTALGGAPGVYSADWAGHPRDFDRAMERVWTELNDSGSTDRSAAFICTLALLEPGGEPRFYEGRVAGTIVWPPRGTGGFGYDAIFVPEGETRTFAEMTAEEKKALSHRGRALAALVAAEFGS